MWLTAFDVALTIKIKNYFISSSLSPLSPLHTLRPRCPPWLTKRRHHPSISTTSTSISGGHHCCHQSRVIIFPLSLHNTTDVAASYYYFHYYPAFLDLVATAAYNRCLLLSPFLSLSPRSSPSLSLSLSLKRQWGVERGLRIIRNLLSGMGDGYVGTAYDAVKIRSLKKQMEAERRKIHELKTKSALANSQPSLLQFGFSTSEGPLFSSLFLPVLRHRPSCPPFREEKLQAQKMNKRKIKGHSRLSFVDDIEDGRERRERWGRWNNFLFLLLLSRRMPSVT